MVLIALAIVFAGLGAMALTKSNSDSASADSATASSPAANPQSAASSAAPVTSAAAAPLTTTAQPTTAPPTTTTAAADISAPVRVLNNSTVAGLAGKTSGQLTAAGFNVAGTGNYASGTISKTTVYYGNSPREQSTAEAVAKQLGATAQPRFPGIANSPPGVIVIVTGR